MTKRLLAMALAASMALPAAAFATDAPQPRRIMVLGEGEATVKPDIAMLSLTVMREAMTAREALDANNKAMAEVIAAMKASGIADRDLQTAGVQIIAALRLHQQAGRHAGSQARRLPGDQHAVGARARPRQDRRDPRQVGDARRQPGRQHHFRQRRPLGDHHRGAQEGRRRRDGQGKDAERRRGVGLGKIVEISEMSYAQPPMPIAAKAFDGAAEAVPVEAGENSYKVQVNVTFELN